MSTGAPKSSASRSRTCGRARGHHGEKPECSVAGRGDDVSRAPSTFKLADIKRAAKAMAGAGFVVTGVKVDRNGGFVILVNDKPSATEVSALDEWMAKHAR